MQGTFPGAKKNKYHRAPRRATRVVARTLRTRSRTDSSVEAASRRIARNAAIRTVSCAEAQRPKHVWKSVALKKLLGGPHLRTYFEIHLYRLAAPDDVWQKFRALVENEDCHLDVAPVPALISGGVLGK